jgi:hypothetical protein
MAPPNRGTDLKPDIENEEDGSVAERFTGSMTFYSLRKVTRHQTGNKRSADASTIYLTTAKTTNKADLQNTLSKEPRLMKVDQRDVIFVSGGG